MAILIEDDENTYLQHRLLSCADSLQQCANYIVDFKWNLENVANIFQKASKELIAINNTLASKEKIEEPVLDQGED